MQRKRSGVYSAGPSVSQHHRHSHPTSTHVPEIHDPHLAVFAGKYSGKGFFSDLRVEVDRELASKHATHPAYLRSKASIMRSLMPSKVSTRSKSVATTAHDSAVMTPSNTRQILRRCQSASAVRKKLINAVEQGSSGGSYQHPNHKLQAQIDVLRNLASNSLPKQQNGYRTSSADMASLSSSILYGTTKPQRMTPVTPVFTCSTQNQDECIAGVGIGHVRSASTSAQSTTTTNQTPSVLVGGYKSSSVQLEVELVERLNEIGRSNLPEKTLSRTRACQSALDNIVKQDEHYGRLLSRIRDEFNIYVGITSRKSPVKSGNNKTTKSWCACGQDIFEFALMKQENVVLKKRVNSMQHEIESLQVALRQAKMDSGSDRSNDSVRDTSSSSSWPEDDQTEEDGLDNIQLFPVEDVHAQHCRPQVVPMLSFASLPVYSDEEDDEEDMEGGYLQ